MNRSAARRRVPLVLVLLGMAGLSACGGHSDPLPTYLIGGTANGLFGTVVLENNGTDRLSVSSNGAFTFATAVRRGDSYAVEIISTPQGQACSLSNAAGVASDHVTNLLLTCTGTGPTFTIGGTVSGLTGQLVLRNNTELLVVSQNGTFTFPTPLRTGLTYAVSIATQPPGQTCTVNDASGTVGTANITSVAVTCASVAPATFTLGGTVSGLTGTVVLRNGTQTLEVNSNGAFTFPTALQNGSAYSVFGASRAISGLMRRAGLKPPKGRIGPRPHDLRHAFARERLRRWYQSGADLQKRLPYLSVYLGHLNLLGTEHYLKASPDLLALASNRMAARFRRGLAGSAEAARRLGVQAVLPKPFTRTELLTAVRAAMEGPE